MASKSAAAAGAGKALHVPAAPKHVFTAEQVDDFKEVFAEADADSSGAIDKEELRAVVAKCGIEVSEMQLGELLKDADSDGSGSIEFVEFLNLMWKLQSGPSERELKNEMFILLDDNLDGFVDVAELRAAFVRMAAADTAAAVPPDEVLAQMISEVALRDGKKFDSDNFQSLLALLKLPKM